MPIKHFGNGGATITGDSINFYALAVHRGVAQLEMKGIRVRRGRLMWKVYRDHYQIPGTGRRKATHAQVCEWLDAKVRELRPQQEDITPDGRRTVNGQEVM